MQLFLIKQVLVAPQYSKSKKCHCSPFFWSKENLALTACKSRSSQSPNSGITWAPFRPHQITHCEFPDLGYPGKLTEDDPGFRPQCYCITQVLWYIASFGFSSITISQTPFVWVVATVPTQQSLQVMGMVPKVTLFNCQVSQTPTQQSHPSTKDAASGQSSNLYHLNNPTNGSFPILTLTSTEEHTFFNWLCHPFSFYDFGNMVMHFPGIV